MSKFFDQNGFNTESLCQPISVPLTLMANLFNVELKVAGHLNTVLVTLTSAAAEVKLVASL